MRNLLHFTYYFRFNFFLKSQLQQEFRDTYGEIIIKKSGTRIPMLELEKIGPSIDWVLRRSQLASDDLFKTACKQVGEICYSLVGF